MPPEPQDPANNSPEKTSNPVPPAPQPAPAPTPAPVPAPPPAQTPASGQVDIDKILLPQKEVRKVESERRVSAGVLLDQEQRAGVEGLPKPEPAPKSVATAKPKEVSEVEPLQTYQADIEKVVQGGSASVVSIAAAEAQRRAHMGNPQIPQAPSVPLQERIVSFFKNFSMIIAGGILLAIAAGVFGYLLLRPTSVPVTVAPTPPFISVDDTEVVSVSVGEPAHDLMDKLTGTKTGVALSLGLIERLIPAIASSTTSGNATIPMDAQTFLSTITRNIPPGLLRTIEPTYLLGVHVYNGNQALLILKVDSYPDAFSGMLDWEATMQNDLAPLFTYTPTPHIPEENIPVVASSTPSITPTKFVDRIVENHDARVLQNDTGDIYLMWTFLDRSTLVITTNAATLREIISRLQEAPVTVTPTN